MRKKIAMKMIGCQKTLKETELEDSSRLKTSNSRPVVLRKKRREGRKMIQAMKKRKTI
jgi:hypothetical protein